MLLAEENKFQFNSKKLTTNMLKRVEMIDLEREKVVDE
jgi:hypothetical protein